MNVYMLVSKEKRKYASVLQLLLLLLLLRKKQRNGISIKVPTDRILPSLLHFFSYIFFLLSKHTNTIKAGKSNKYMQTMKSNKKYFEPV